MEAVEFIINTADVLNKYSSLVLVIVTIIYAKYTHTLAKETTKLREVETMPLISISVNFYSSMGNSLITIQNISKSPAYNIEFEVDEKYKGVFAFNFNNKIPYLAQIRK